MSALAPLRIVQFRNFWAAILVSNLGTMIQSVGAAWMMTSMTDSAAMVALVQSSTSLPIMFLALVGGAVADSFDRRMVMLTAQIFRFVTSMVLVLLAWLGLISPWPLLVLTFLLGCGVAINNPAWQATVGDLVPRADLASAVAINSVGFNLSRSVGPAIGGVIVAAAGAVASFVVNAASYLMLIVILWRWRPAAAAAPLPREAIGPAIATGLRYVAMSPGTLKILLRSFVFGVSAAAVPALLPVVAREILGGGPLVYGGLLAAFGAGAVGGAMLGKAWQARVGIETVVRSAFAGFALCAAIAGLSSSPWLIGAGLALGGACWVLTFSLFNAAVQLSTPRWVVGRVLSTFQMVTFGGMALGSWGWGATADLFGLQLVHGLSAALMLLGGALGLLLPLPRQASASLDPVGQWHEPLLAVPLEQRDGPVHIEIAYRIRAANLQGFLLLMAERRRIRRRDGVQHWLLLRDLVQPEVWLERYVTPTWVDYIRHNLRRTQADAAVHQGLLALHEGPEPPVVRRYVESQPGRRGAASNDRHEDGAV